MCSYVLTGFGDDEHSGLGSGVGTGTAASSSSRNASKHSGVKWNRVERQMEPSRSDFCREFEGAALKREGGGMRSVASAPDFSQMKRMHDTFKSTDTAKTKSKRNLQAVRPKVPTKQPPSNRVCFLLNIPSTRPV